jgi:hypothetical protein
MKMLNALSSNDLETQSGLTSVHFLRAVVLFMISFGICCSAKEENPAQAALIPNDAVEVILNHPSLKKYYHPEVPGRIPLLVSEHLLEDSVTFEIFGMPVRVAPDSALESRPHVKFIQYDLHGHRASVTIEYRVEGVRGVFYLKKKENELWKIVKAKVTES